MTSAHIAKLHAGRKAAHDRKREVGIQLAVAERTYIRLMSRRDSAARNGVITKDSAEYAAASDAMAKLLASMNGQRPNDTDYENAYVAGRIARPGG